MLIGISDVRIFYKHRGTLKACSSAPNAMSSHSLWLYTSLRWPEYLKAKQQAICAGNTGTKRGFRGICSCSHYWRSPWGSLMEEVWWRRGQAKLQGLPALGPIHNKSFVKSLPLEKLVEKCSFPSPNHKINGFSILVWRPWSQLYTFGRLLYCY